MELVHCGLLPPTSILIQMLHTDWLCCSTLSAVGESAVAKGHLLKMEIFSCFREVSEEDVQISLNDSIPDETKRETYMEL